MSVWLAGAGGMLGRAFAAGLAELDVPCDPTGSELDISDRAAVLARAEAGGYRWIINCASYTAVDGAESDRERAMAVNRDGPAHLGEAAAATGASVVHISTDYVFDGRATEPYAEDAPAGPLGVYGASKLEGERRLAAATGDAWIVRTSWLFGSGGRNFVSTMLELMEQRAAVQVVSDQIGRPTYCPDLVDAALALAGVSRPTPAPFGIYHFANAGSTSWRGLADEILRQARELGRELSCGRVEAIATAALDQPARRPAYSVLSTERIERELGAAPPSWQSGVARFLAEGG